MPSNRSKPFASLFARCPSPLVPYKKQYINLLSENDAYVYPADRYYSAGNRLSYTSKEYNFWGAAYAHSWMAWSRYLTLMIHSPKMTRFSVSMTQTMYTPHLDSHTSKAIVMGDHLYAGWLRANFALFQRAPHALEKIFISLGTVGPDSMAGQTQNWLHGLWGDKTFQGWHNQLRNEFIFQFNYQWLYQVYILKTRFFSMDILPGVDLALGNAITHVRLGSLLRFGYNLSADFGPNKIGTLFSGGQPFSNHFSFYFFIGASGSYQPVDIFIQGNSPQTRGITHLPDALYAVEGGFALLYRGFRLSFIATNLSKGFEEQPLSHNIGTAELDIAF
ncbi:lipid A deacylase LpxR family protein [Helicobacter heilmannii]|uniref:lipid A deacylase LpxR family protein n=1 Tax=Helicobacter heilmannii TaxID=35817 RepID=UPI0018D1A406